MGRTELVGAVTAAEAVLQSAKSKVEDFDALAENNVFESVDKAESTLEDILRDRALADCEGAGNCGADKYTQLFIVDGITYLATLTVEYNRHDKTYYYIEVAALTVAQVSA